MRTLFFGLTLALAAMVTMTAPFLLTSSRADQNPAPTNVGLYNYSTFTVGTSTTIPILPRNLARAGIILQNNGASSVVIKAGSTPANATDGIVLIAGAIFQPNIPFTDAIYGKSASATDLITMHEFVK
jgi:hypothetical protein